MAHKEAKWVFHDLLHLQYWVIWAVLLVFTFIEVVIPEPSLVGLDTFPRTFVIIALIMIALVKTVLVAGYYMHLIGDKPAMIMVAATPFIFSIFLTIGIFPY